MSRKNKVKTDGDLLVVEKPAVQRPRQYKVLLHNDDFTPMEFVVMILCDVFHKDKDEAVHLMLTVHKKGKAICGLFPKSVAEAKVAKVMDLAKQQQHPLMCSMEPA